MKYVILAMLISVSATAQRSELNIDYKTTGTRYDSATRAIRYSDKDYTNRPDKIIIDKQEKFIHVIYKDKVDKYSIDTSKFINIAVAGAGGIHFTCTKKGVVDKYDLYWFFYERSQHDTFFEFIVQAPDYVEKYNIKID